MLQPITLQTEPLSRGGNVDVDSFVQLVMSRANTKINNQVLQYTQEQVRQIGDSIFKWCKVFSIDGQCVAAQILHETGFFHYGNDVKPGQYNFAGLGATGGIPGHSFPSIDAGVLAVFVHWSVYLRGPSEYWNPLIAPYGTTQYDPRYQAVVDAGFAGNVSVLSDLNKKWAEGDKYAEAIVATANMLIGVEQVKQVPPPVTLHIDHIPWNNSNNPQMAALHDGRIWITIHETANTNVGANAKMHRNYVHGSNGYGGGGYPAYTDSSGKHHERYEGVSFIYVVDDHEVYELLSRGSRSWQASDGANGPGNSSVSIETCVNQDGNWNKTVENLAQHIVWLTRVDPNLSTDRIRQHNYWARDHKNCPTNLRANNNAGWNALIRRVKEIEATFVTPPGPETEPAIGEKIGNFYVVGSILQRYRDLGPLGLPETGYPITGEFSAPVGGINRHVQGFERGWYAKYPVDVPDGVPVSDRFYVRKLFKHEIEEVITYGLANDLISDDVLHY